MQRPIIDVLTEGHLDPGAWFRRYELYIELYVYRTPIDKANEGSDDSGKGDMDESLDRLRGKYLPFFLGGRVLVTYEQLTLGERNHYALAKSRLLAAYMMSPSMAYAKFTSSKFTGGSVDMFAAELRRLLELVPGMQSLAPAAKDGLIVEQLLRGLPAALSRELRLVCVDTLTGAVTLSSVLERSRLLPELEESQREQGSERSRAIICAAPRTPRKQRCFRCGEEGHIRSDCKSQSDLCFKCGKPGHRQRDCPNGPGSQPKTGMAGSQMSSQ
jgi:hypothetical protein